MNCKHVSYAGEPSNDKLGGLCDSWAREPRMLRLGACFVHVNIHIINITTSLRVDRPQRKSMGD
jgi:hypothetical protein